jgi:predicted ArsR family transcriptional regulator
MSATPTEPSAFKHARRAAEHLASAATELALAKGAALEELAGIGAEFGLLRWRASAVVAALGESLEHVREAKGRLP